MGPIRNLLPHPPRHRIIAKYDIRGDFEAARGMNSARRAGSSEIHIPCCAEAKSFGSARYKIVVKKYGYPPDGLDMSALAMRVQGTNVRGVGTGAYCKSGEGAQAEIKMPAASEMKRRSALLLPPVGI
jgi:hypothetical protein